MFVNEDLFTKAGLNPKTDIPKTWEDIYKVAKIINEKTGAYGFYLQQATDNWAQQGMLESAGGKLLTYVDGVLTATFALVMMTSQFINDVFLVKTDPGRLGAQVISGIGFLCAGTILLTGQNQVKGLTTAAGLWAAACMGLAIGIGFYFGGIAICIIIFMTMTIMEKCQNRFMKKMSRICIYLVMENATSIVSFINYVREHEMTLLDFESINSNGIVGFSCMIKPEKRMDHTTMLAILSACEGVKFIEEI